MKRFLDSRQYEIAVPREMHIEMELRSFDAVMRCLVERNWTVLEATDETGPFITCDHPLNLEWKEPETIPPLYRNSPGHGMRDTWVRFPISKRLAIVGEFDGPEERHRARPGLVASINSLALRHCQRNLITPHVGKL